MKRTVRRREAGWKRRVFPLTLLIALFLHAPLAPLRLTAWLFGWSKTGAMSDYDEADAEAIVPLDLDLMEQDLKAHEDLAAAAAAAKASPPAGNEGEGDAGPVRVTNDLDAGADGGARKPKKKPEDLDAGVDTTAASDAGDAGELADAGDAGPIAHLKEATEAAGGAGEIVAKDPNVQVLIAGQCLRKHELGPWFGRLLREIPEWNSFFEGTPIDPIKDLAHLLITGPQFRESSKIVAVMDYTVTDAKMRSVVDDVVKRAHGTWLKDTKIPAAVAKVEGGERIFALVPGKNLLVVLPASSKKDVDGLVSRKGFSKACTAGIVIGMKTPSRPFATVFPLPETLASLRVAVIPTSDGGADVQIEAADKTAELAAKDAADVEKRFDLLRKVELGITTLEVMDHVDFKAEGATIKAKTHVTRTQLKFVLGAAEAQVKQRLAERRGPVDAGK